MKTLYIDDIRPVPEQYNHYARTYIDALKMIMYEDWDQISFDHDLGSEDPKETGLELMNILEASIYIGVRKAPLVCVHTDNGGAMKAMKQAANKINSMRRTK